jgi:hypothetical protein
MGGLVWMTSWLLRGLYATLRPVFVQQVWEDSVRQCEKPVLLTFWHGRMAYFIYLYRYQHFTVMVSQSRDGEFVSRILARFGIHSTRGSSSHGGMRALLELVQCLRQGCHVAVTPDGPRGPRYQVQPGVIVLAQKTGIPILPVTYNARWKVVLGSWDRFILPLPFSRVVVVYGEPITIPTSVSATVRQAKRLEVERSLQRITQMADTYFQA